MKKKLSDDALDILAVAVTGGWPMHGSELMPVAELVARGFITADDKCLGVVLLPTTAGVRFLINRNLAVQNGTTFALAPDVKPTRVREQLSMSMQLRPPLRVVEPKAPDPFKEGMDAAMKSVGGIGPDICKYSQGSQEAQDWASGYRAGEQVKQQGIA